MALRMLVRRYALKEGHIMKLGKQGLTEVLQNLAFVTALPPDAAWLRIYDLPWPEIDGRFVCGTLI